MKNIHKSEQNCSKKILNFRDLVDILQLLSFPDVEAANLVFTVQNLIVNSRPFPGRVLPYI